MATVENGSQARPPLPSLSHLDLEKYHHSDMAGTSRFSTMPNLSISTGNAGSPTTCHSGPPPPYSSAASVVGSVQGLPGYISPPDSNSRRSTRDDKDSISLAKALPSISEALKCASDLNPTSQYDSGSAPPSAVTSAFGEAPRGPGNPFSQTPNQPMPGRSSFSSAPVIHDPPPIKSIPPHLSAAELQRLPQDTPMFRSPFDADTRRSAHYFTDHNTSPHSVIPQPGQHHAYEPNGHYDDHRPPFTKDTRQSSYGETVKRHLDIYDAELALSEISEASARTLDFSKVWTQRYHQSNRTSYFSDSLPGPTEIEDMMRQSHRVLDSLSRMREIAIMQQNILNEQRARAIRGHHPDDEYYNSEDFKAGGFAGGDAKKRRGKAAPPGRCHSCNRAETPEWRRGPDGARTLCNACGLHYAKLTRKMGANKAAVLTGSNLRPKNLSDPRS